MFTPESIRTLARKAASAVEGQGTGHTVYSLGAHKRRYVVGGLATRIYPVGEAVGAVRKGMRAMADGYAGATADTMGYWEDAGAVYVDLGDAWESVHTATLMAQARGELAIYDRETGECIYLACPTPVACEEGCTCRVA